MNRQRNFDDEILYLIDEYSISYKKDKSNKKKYEQYFTSMQLARFMSGMITDIDKKEVSILDPGCGLGILSICAIWKIVTMYPGVKVIKVDLYEIDDKLIKRLIKIFDKLVVLCSKRRVVLHVNIINDDFITKGIEKIKEGGGRVYDIAILNPPYGKIETNSAIDTTLKNIDIDVPNLYAAFVAIAGQLLIERGQLIAITPRSFCNGVYFTKFRRLIFENMSLSKIHLFDSRENCFSSDNVLQEIVIYKVINTVQGQNVVISYSMDDKLDDYIEREEMATKIIDTEDEHMFIKIVKDNHDEVVVDVVESMPCSIEEIGLSVSTGPIVDFRVNKGLLTKEIILGAVPSIFPEHLNGTTITWPLLDIKKKYNYIFPDSTVKNQLRPNGTYVLVKRFTSKEEAKRVVARVWDENLTNMDHIGIDNKLNYYHINKAGINLELAMGLMKYLNSNVVDRWFRTISGSTQVNVTDLKKLRYPSQDVLLQMAALDENEDIDEYLRGVAREL